MSSKSWLTASGSSKKFKIVDAGLRRNDFANETSSKIVRGTPKVAGFLDQDHLALQFVVSADIEKMFRQILNNMSNQLSGSNDEGAVACEQLIAMLASVDIVLHQWSSNSQTLLDTSSGTPSDVDHKASVTMLVLRWESLTDFLLFKPFYWTEF